MSPDQTFEKPVWHIGIVFAVASLLFVVLVAAVKFSVTVPAIDADRAAVRAKALAEIRATEAAALATPGWIDQDRNIVRLPIDLALQKAAADWKNPAAARADLIGRAEKAAAPMQPVAPKPSAFE
jgi:hypothetical protein